MTDTRFCKLVDAPAQVQVSNARLGAGSFSLLSSSGWGKTGRPAILAAIGLGPQWRAVADASLALGRQLHWPVVLLHVVQQPYGHWFLDSSHRRRSDSESRLWAKEQLESLAPPAEEVPVRCLVRFGLPTHVILRTAESERVALLVLGHRPTSPLTRALAGNLTQEIIDNSPCPVLVIVQGASGTEREDTFTGPGRALAQPEKAKSKLNPSS